MTWERKNLFAPTYLTPEFAVYFTATQPTRIDELHVRNEAAGVVAVGMQLIPADGDPTTFTANPHPGATWDVDAIIGRTLAAGDRIEGQASAHPVALTGIGTFM